PLASGRTPPVAWRRQARVYLARRTDLGDRAAGEPAVPGVLRRGVPDRVAARRHDRQVLAGGRAAPGRRTRDAAPGWGRRSRERRRIRRTESTIKLEPYLAGGRVTAPARSVFR